MPTTLDGVWVCDFCAGLLDWNTVNISTPEQGLQPVPLNLLDTFNELI